jgi:protein SCO1/2
LKNAAAFVALLGALVALAGCGGASPSAEATHTSAPNYGTLVDLEVPPKLERLPLTNQRGEKVSLDSWHGKTVVLVPFLTLCADVCPMTTGILMQVERELRAHHASNVEIVELTVDPRRDTPARLAAYGKITHAGWQLVTESPSTLKSLAQFFGFTYEKIGEDNPPDIDWWTGKPLTYDVDHSDNYFVIDPSGHERVVQEAAPDYHGRLPAKLKKFLNPLGRQHYKHAPRPAWTTANVLEAIEHVTGEKLSSAA